MFDVWRHFSCIAYREVRSNPLRNSWDRQRTFSGYLDGCLLGLLRNGIIPTQILSPVHSVEGTWMDLYLNDHGLRLERTFCIQYFIFSSHWDIGTYGRRSQGRVCLRTIEGVGCTWRHCPVASICMKRLLLGCGAEALDRSVSKRDISRNGFNARSDMLQPRSRFSRPKSHDVDCSKFHWKRCWHENGA